MSRDTILLVLAVVIAVSPFAGLPIAWLSYILPVVGLIILIIGISQRRDRRARIQEPQAT
jgi:TRAP-type C4-dicarboxylate transport system permease small subunit